MWVWTLAGMHCNAWKEENTHLQIKRNTPTIKIMYINSQADLVSGNKLVHQRWHWRACVEARGPTYHGRNVSSTRRVLNYFSISSFSPLHFYFILSSFYSNLLYFPLFFQNNSSSHAWNVSPVLSHWLPDDWQMPPTLLKEGLATHARPSTPPVKAEGKKKTGPVNCHKIKGENEAHIPYCSRWRDGPCTSLPNPHCWNSQVPSWRYSE